MGKKDNDSFTSSRNKTRLGDVIDAIKGVRPNVSVDDAVLCLQDLYGSKRRWRGRYKELKSALEKEIAKAKEANDVKTVKILQSVAEGCSVELADDPRRKCCAACNELRLAVKVALSVSREFKKLREIENSEAYKRFPLESMDAAFDRLDEALQYYSYAMDGVLLTDDKDPVL